MAGYIAGLSEGGGESTNTTFEKICELPRLASVEFGDYVIYVAVGTVDTKQLQLYYQNTTTKATTSVVNRQAIYVLIQYKQEIIAASIYRWLNEFIERYKSNKTVDMGDSYIYSYTFSDGYVDKDQRAVIFPYVEKETNYSGTKEETYDSSLWVYWSQLFNVAGYMNDPTVGKFRKICEDVRDAIYRS